MKKFTILTTVILIIMLFTSVYVNADALKWVSFDVPASAMEKALKLEIKAREEGRYCSFIDLLALLATKYGGQWDKYKPSHLDEYAKMYADGKSPELTKSAGFNYYMRAYEAVLGDFVGDYYGADGQETFGVRAKSPIAGGCGFHHYDDFGDSRSFGYKRRHLGNDLMGSVGTPIIAIEDGIVEIAAWNRFGGWRIGIRSLDSMRYYYYAHLRRNHPFHSDIKDGQLVSAGEVIGYLGRTGYSSEENKNNIEVAHLHLGLQLIFEEWQKETVNEIWIDVYDIVEFLRRRTSSTVWNTQTNEHDEKVRMIPMIYGD